MGRQVTTITLPTVEAQVFARVQPGESFWLVREACYDLRCPTCGGSASLPLGMTCADHRPQRTPPVEFVRACAPCECIGKPSYSNIGPDHDGSPDECPNCDMGRCRIELVGPCPNDTDGDGDCWHCSKPGQHHTLGHAYAVGQPLPIDWAKCNRSEPFIGAWEPPYPPTVLFAEYGIDGTPISLAHYGDPAGLVGKWAIELRVTP